MILTNSLVRLWSLLSASMASLVTVSMTCSIMVASMEKNLWRPKTLTDMCAAGGMATLFDHGRVNGEEPLETQDLDRHV